MRRPFLLDGLLRGSCHDDTKRRRCIGCRRHLKSRPDRHAAADDVTVARLIRNRRHATFAFSSKILKITGTGIIRRGLEFVFHARGQKLYFQIVQEDTACAQSRIRSGLTRLTDIIGTLHAKLKSVVLRARHKKAVSLSSCRCAADTIRQSRTRWVVSISILVWGCIWGCIVCRYVRLRISSFV